MLATDAHTIVGAAIAAFVAVFAGALALKTKLGFSWLGRKIKAALKRAFVEAIDEHVAPEFEVLRQNTVDRAAEIKSEAMAAAEQVRVEAEANASRVEEALRVHTMEEGEIVRVIVKQEIEPIIEKMDQQRQELLGKIASARDQLLVAGGQPEGGKS